MTETDGGERILLVETDAVALLDLLPCEVCGWMRTPGAWTCTCGRPELRAGAYWSAELVAARADRDAALPAAAPVERAA